MKIHSPSSLKGQSLVEMALLLPVLLLLSVVTFDLGRGIYYYSAVYNAAREGARYGIINPEDSEGIQEAAKKLTVGLDQNQLIVSSCECANDIISVNVKFTFQLVTPLSNLVLGSNSYTLQSTSMMVIER